MVELTENTVKNQTLGLLGPSGANLASRSPCLPGTRHDIIRNLQRWAIQPSLDDPSTVMWLYGVAGGGKSAVAATIATHASQLGRLGAFISFDRAAPESIHPSKVVQALAHQIALFDGRIRASIIKSINEDTKILTAPLSEQFDELILKPLKHIPELCGEGPIVIVFDALDECGRANNRASLLKVLGGQTKSLPSNFRFLITSRTVEDIREVFNISKTHIKSECLGLNDGHNDSDITLYFHSRMQIIRQKNKDLQKDWPGPAALVKLSSRAHGFFSWAVAASDFVDAFDPAERLNTVLLEENPTSDVDLSLDNLYAAALESAGDWSDSHFVADFRATMAAIIASPILLSMAAISRLLRRTLRRPLMVTIQRLGGLLMIHKSIVRLLHPSLVDFLTSRIRCGRDIWCFEPGPAGQASSLPAVKCLQLMNIELKRNICGMDFTLPLNAAVIHEDLAFTCQSWDDHVCTVVEHQSWVIEELKVFLCEHLLHWIEAMSIIEKVEKIPLMLERLVPWLAVRHIVLLIIKILNYFIGE